MSRRRTAVLAAALAAAGVTAAAVAALREGPPALDRARGGAAEPGVAEQVVALEAAGGVYTPNVVRLRAGVPLRLRVTVRERHGCATRLLVPDLGVDLALTPGGTVEALLPPPAAGTYLFTCGQKMVKGTLVVE